MSMTLERFGEAVRSARKKQEYSQEELASAVDVSRTYLSQIEQGRAKNLSLRLAERLSTTLGIESPYQEEGGSLENIPASLRDFAKQDNIPDGDVRMLARIEYRGQRPQDPQGWRVLYNVIKTTSQPGSQNDG